MNESWRQGREKVTALVHLSGERGGAVLGEGTVCRASALSPVLLLSLDSVNGLA